MDGNIGLPVTDITEPFIDIDDIAEVVIASLTDDRHSGQLYEVTGPELISFADIAARFSKHLNRRVNFESISIAEFQSRLADILVIAAMRQYLSGLDDSQTSWLTALEDDRIGKSLRLLHDQPDRHWSLEELATTVGMSRTSFATQFKKLVGNTPMDYLTEWRMSLAYSSLQLTKDTMLSIALDIGYQ